MNKKCTSCGASLAVEASFCPHCATVQREKYGMMPPKQWKKTALKGAGGFLILLAVVLAVCIGEREPKLPQEQTNGGESLSVASGVQIAASSTPSAEPTLLVEPVSAAAPMPEVESVPSTGPTPAVESVPSTGPTPAVEPVPSTEPTPAVKPTPSEEPTASLEPVSVKGPEAVWKDGEKEYRLTLSFWGDRPEEWKQPVEQVEITCHPDFNFQTDSVLYVWDAQTGEGALHEFAKELTGIVVTGTTIEGGGVRTSQAESSGAMWKSTVGYNAQSGTGEVCWTLVMKNGDVITLSHRMVVSPYPTVTISSANAKLGTAAELQAALDAIPKSDLKEKFILLDLPGVVYEEHIVLPNGRYEINCADWDCLPNFAGGLTVSGGEVTCTGIRFEGAEGVGITADGNIMMYECIVSGWDTGVLVNDGAWAAVHGSTFENNGIGLHFNSTRSNFLNPQYDGNTFVGNGTALLFENVPYSPVFTFPGTLFSGNGQNFDNRCGKKLDTSFSRFEE